MKAPADTCPRQAIRSGRLIAIEAKSQFAARERRDLSPPAQRCAFRKSALRSRAIHF
jgi:hypothetical protein